jgi:hypothetical protein
LRCRSAASRPASSRSACRRSGSSCFAEFEYEPPIVLNVPAVELIADRLWLELTSTQLNGILSGITIFGS